ncbi:putative dynein heavy chain [Trypanosoma cruzi]|uniref:Putative dynein heavy chain n=1 Tax=Trypanosoma cruzi TaxID=5693 RepID=A0A2V2VUN5_TRYCR|nr:putative dynein heavy chain [Trypanosoma cruzi]
MSAESRNGQPRDEEDPRLAWLAARVKSCLYGVDDDVIADLYGDIDSRKVILEIFDNPKERFLVISSQEATTTEGKAVGGRLSMATPRKTPPKLIATTLAIKNSNITGSTNFPPDRTRCIFFLRVQNVQLTRELVHNWRTETECPIHRAFEISCMVVPSLSSFHTILKYAYGPIVEDVVSSAGRRRCVATKKIANRQLYTEILNWVHRVDMQMTGFRNQVCAERRLPMPQALVSMGYSDSGLKSALANEDVIKQIDITVSQWQAEISYAMSLDPQKEGPLGEIEYWREKYSTISALYEQINSPQAKFILKVAKEAECNSFHLISTTIQHFFRLYAEAKDNVKFLGTLDRHFRTMHGVTPGSGSLQPIIDTLSSMMTGIRMVWIISRYYCTEERMVGLLEKVGKLIAQKVSQHIDFRSILGLPFSEAKEKVIEGQQCLIKWKATYVNVQEEINSSEREQPWNFNQKRLFETTDYMSDRCTDLLEVIETVEYYNTVLGAQLKTVLTDTSGIERILKDVERVKRPFETLTFDPFERKATHNWQVVYSNFVNTVANLDHEVSEFINKIFDDDLRSAESAFELLVSFKGIVSRPQRAGEAFDTASLLSEKADRILAQYFSEVERVRSIFVENRDNPPLTKNQPPVAGAIHWSTSLFQRLKKPIVRFQQEGMLVTAMGRQVRAKYVEVARQMKEYATSRFIQWSEGVRQTTTASLKMNILRKGNGETYVTNFDVALFNVIREAKYLDRLGFEVPQEAINVTLQDESYHANVDALKAMLLNFNCELQGALDGPERVILAKNIRELRLALEPGIHDINWTSLGVTDFVANCERAITKFRNLSREVRKRADHIQTQVVNKIGSTKLIPEFEQLLQAGGELPELQVFVDTIERRRTTLVDACLRAYHTAKPLLTKMESQLVGTHTGKCLILESYYLHWEQRIWKALTRMVLNSLLAFAKMLGYRGSSTVKRPPLFKVLIFLTTEPTFSPPHQEITSAFHKVQSSIIESTQRFQRWMRGTCIEFTQGELVPRPAEGEQETLFTYYKDINSLPQVYKLQGIINRTIQTHLSALATNIKMLQRYRFIYLRIKNFLWNSRQRVSFTGLTMTQNFNFTLT